MCLWWVNEELDLVLVCKREKSWIQKVYSCMFLIIEEKRSKSISFLEFLSWQAKAKSCHWRKETGGDRHKITWKYSYTHSYLWILLSVSPDETTWNRQGFTPTSELQEEPTTTTHSFTYQHTHTHTCTVHMRTLSVLVTYGKSHFTKCVWSVRRREHWTQQ